ncbi:hypothetical protein THIOKS11120016 [Thiocapsa sp. KS1]|nr:hypothetical protein THIOKS11120016 [Thiocapsa sp. KS1]
MDGAAPASSTLLNGPLAQRLEQGTHNPLVLGSNPRRPTNPDPRCFRFRFEPMSGPGMSMVIFSRIGIGNPGRCIGRRSDWGSLSVKIAPASDDSFCHLRNAFGGNAVTIAPRRGESSREAWSVQSAPSSVACLHPRAFAVVSS